MKPKEIRYYHHYTDDFTQSADQDHTLPADYPYVRTDPLSRCLSVLVYLLAVAFGGVYCRWVLHMHIHGRKRIKKIKGGFFLYGNHTQPFGDVVIPALCLWPKRIYTVAGTANYGIPVIGKLLPYLGALPMVHSISGVKKLTQAMEMRLQQGHPIVIFPEAHVWEYCTQIRPFPDTSFKFPVKWGKPAVVMTVTYKKARLFKRPRMDVYLDGPFYPEGNTAKEQTAALHRQVFRTMQQRSESSDFAYIDYRPYESHV